MQVTTGMAYPTSYNEHVQTCRTRKGPTAAACSCCVFFVDDEEASAGLLALVLQLPLEHAPTGIQHGFGHPGLGELETADITDDDRLIGFYDLARKLVQRVLSAPGGPAMQPFGLTFVAAALG
ncbi:MAG TPA: hypothetical protein VGI93_17755, partial [Steroidobacteraceae bacterium]